MSKKPGAAEAPAKQMPLKVKVIVAVAIAAALIAAAMLLSPAEPPGLVGKWELESEVLIENFMGLEIVIPANITEYWVHLRKDGTGITSDDDLFRWEATEDKLFLKGFRVDSELMDVTFDYLLYNDSLTVRARVPRGIMEQVYRRM